MQLHHINIKAPADLLDEEKQFFCDVLELAEGPRPQFTSAGYWLYSGDQPIVHLSVSQRHFGSERQGYFDHVAFQTTGLEKLLQRLGDSGIDYSTSFVDACDMTQVFFKSPTGTGIEINFVAETLS